MPALPRSRSSGIIARQQQRAEEGDAEGFEAQGGGPARAGGAKPGGQAAATWTGAMAGKTAWPLALSPKLALPALALALLVLLWLGGWGPSPASLSPTV